MQPTGQLVDAKNDSEIRYILHSFGRLAFFLNWCCVRLARLKGELMLEFDVFQDLQAVRRHLKIAS